MRTALIRVVLILTGLASAIGVVIITDHVYMRHLRKSGHFKAMTPDRQQRFVTGEYDVTVEISAQGIRNPPVTIPKPDDAFRLAIGDSFTYGWGVPLENAWIKRVEKRLSLPGKRVEIINAAVPDIATDDEGDVCSAYASNMEADLILLGFYGTDDLFQNAVIDATQSSWRERLRLVFPAFTSRQRRIMVQLGQVRPGSNEPSDMSKFWSGLSTTFFRLHPEKLKAMDHVLVEDFLRGRINYDLLAYAHAAPEFLVRMLDPGSLSYGVQVTEKSLRRLKRLCGYRPVVVILIPPMEMVEKEYQSFRRKTGYQVDEALLTLDIESPLREITDSLSMPLISLVDDFRSDGCPGCYYPWDIHFTAYGNRRAADYIAPRLQDIISRSAR